MTPDLSIVKIESRNAEIDTGGLDMYVDMPEHGVMQLHRRSDDDQGEHSDIEYEEPSGDWSREDMSNEGSNISGDQNNSWYVGTFKGRCHFFYQFVTKEKHSKVSPHAKYLREKTLVC